jgi:hypothetical protein
MITKLSEMNYEATRVIFVDSAGFSKGNEKAMAFADRSRAFRKQTQGSADRGERLFAGVVLSVLIATLGVRNALPIEALAPAIATLLFVLGGASAGVALLWRRNQARTMWFDIAGMLTFVGVAVSVLIEPDQMVRLFIQSDQPD